MVEKHKLGLTKRHFPFVLRRKLYNFDKLQKTCLDIISNVDDDFSAQFNNAEKIIPDKEFFKDTNKYGNHFCYPNNGGKEEYIKETKKYDSDSKFQLNGVDGTNFVKSNQAIYGNYSVVAFQEISDEMVEYSNDLEYNEDSTPYQRQRGMISMEPPYYHPKYDERSYTQFTPFASPDVRDFLETFSEYGEQSCRSSLVKLNPKMYLSPHWDMGPEFASRFQIPIVATDGMEMGFRKNKNHPWKVYKFEEGYAYFVNTGYEHYARNDDETTRYQVRVCVIGQRLLWDYNEVEPNFEKTNWDD